MRKQSIRAFLGQFKQYIPILMCNKQTREVHIRRKTTFTQLNNISKGSYLPNSIEEVRVVTKKLNIVG